MKHIPPMPLEFFLPRPEGQKPENAEHVDVHVRIPLAEIEYITGPRLLLWSPQSPMRTDHQSLAEGLRARRQLLQSGTPEEANAVIVGQSLGVPLLAPIHEGGIAYAEAIQYVRLRHDHLDQVLDAYRMELSEKRSETARHFALEDIPRYLPALFENSATMTTDEIATQIQRYTKNTCISGRLVERFLREYRDLQREGRFLGPPYLVERQLGVWASENEKPGDYG